MSATHTYIFFFQNSGSGPPPGFKYGFNPWPSNLPPFINSAFILGGMFPNVGAAGFQFSTGLLNAGTLEWVLATGDGYLLIVGFVDGTVRVHTGLPAYMVQELIQITYPEQYYNRNIRFVFPQITTQVDPGATQGSNVIPAAFAGGIKDGDHLMIVPLVGAPFLNTVNTVVSDLVILLNPLPVDLPAGTFVIDLDNQT